MFKRTPCHHVTAMIAAYESEKTVKHLGSFVAFIILCCINCCRSGLTHVATPFRARNKREGGPPLCNTSSEAGALPSEVPSRITR